MKTKVLGEVSKCRVQILIHVMIPSKYVKTRYIQTWELTPGKEQGTVTTEKLCEVRNRNFYFKNVFAVTVRKVFYFLMYFEGSVQPDAFPLTKC